MLKKFSRTILGPRGKKTVQIRYEEEFNHIFALVESPRIEQQEVFRSFERYIEVNFSSSEAAIGS